MSGAESAAQEVFLNCDFLDDFLSLLSLLLPLLFLLLDDDHLLCTIHQQQLLHARLGARRELDGLVALANVLLGCSWLIAIRIFGEVQVIPFVHVVLCFGFQRPVLVLIVARVAVQLFDHDVLEVVTGTAEFAKNILWRVDGLCKAKGITRQRNGDFFTLQGGALLASFNLRFLLTTGAPCCCRAMA